MSWKFEHAVECPVSRAFAWQFWSTPENWLFDPSVESVTLDGPFAAGTRGTTMPRGGDLINWQLVEVEDGHRAVIEIALPAVIVRFHWQFDELTNAATRIRQRVTMEGKLSEEYLIGAAALEQGIPEGMKRLCEEMVKATR